MEKLHYRIKPCFSVVVHSPNSVELRKGVWNSVTYKLNDDTQSNKLAEIILSIDGTKSVSDIAKEHDTKRSEIEGLIDHLRRLDAIETGTSNLVDYYIDEAQLPFPGINFQSKQPVVFIGDREINDKIIQQLLPYFSDDKQVRSLDAEDPLYQSLMSKPLHEFEQELTFQKISEQADNLKGSLIVFTTKTINPDLFLKFNTLANRTGINWMHGCIDGPMIYIGPMFFAEKGPCYYCFEKRISMNIMENHSYVEYKKALLKNNVKMAQFVSPVLINLLASHMSMEILNYILTKNTYLCNRVLSIYLPTKEIGYNELLRFPDCPVCGSMRERDSQTTYFDKQMALQEG